MNNILNKNKIEYVLHHLQMVYDIPTKVKDLFQFVSKDFNHFSKGKIYFILSPNNLVLDDIIEVNKIPILFPGIKNKNSFSYENDYLIFNHDLLKSSFYLLSGYQEYNFKRSDHLGRYHFENSIQFKLNATSIPLVNYYFKEIVNGINIFLKNTNSNNTIKPKSLFKNFGFLLTHDVDRVKLYSLNSILYKLKQIIGINKRPYSFKKTLSLLIEYSFKYLFPFYKDPYWNFKELTEYESSLNFRSVWFFLNKNQKHIDSYYDFKNRKILHLFKLLYNKGNEIGLHGTVQSMDDVDHLKWQKDLLENTCGQKINGIRQHRLMYRYPQTCIVHKDSNINYDSSLGFAFHEGFRNSYCLPFKLYDFENDCEFPTWEFSLNVMDTTLFDYRKLNFSEAQTEILKIISQIKKFNGLFTLLWHNHYFDEDKYPGITEFYHKILKDICLQEPENILGKDLLIKLSEKWG